LTCCDGHKKGPNLSDGNFSLSLSFTSSSSSFTTKYFSAFFLPDHHDHESEGSFHPHTQTHMYGEREREEILMKISSLFTTKLKKKKKKRKMFL
jgi:hypothetical protein